MATEINPTSGAPTCPLMSDPTYELELFGHFLFSLLNVCQKFKIFLLNPFSGLLSWYEHRVVDDTRSMDYAPAQLV